MRNGLLLLCAMLCSLAGGCSSGFQGEWLEDGVALSDGTVTPMPADQRKLALKFDVPWVVRYGQFVESMNVVDPQSVQGNEYSTFEGGEKAEFGAMIARREGNRLVLVVGDNPIQRHFTKVQGRSIFPAHVRWPVMTDAAGKIPMDQYAGFYDRLDRMLLEEETRVSRAG